MGGKTSKSTQAITIPPEVLARYNAINARADTVTNRPYQYYQGQFVAPLTATQQSGISNTNAAAGMAQPYFAQATDTLNNAQAATQPYFNTAGQAYGAGLGQGQEYLGAATGYAQQGGQAVNASDLNGDAIGKYLSPFLGTVLQGTAGILNQQNQQQQAGQMGNAIRSGAFGGDRGGIAAANLNQQQNLANAKIYSDILNQGYNTALETAVGQQAVGLGAAQANRTAQQQTADRIAALGKQGFDQFSTTGQNVQGLGKDVYNVGAATSAAQAALGTGAQDAALTGAAAQMTAGQVEQATEQAERTARYNEFLQAQSLPYQQLKLAGDIALGTGTASGSTTTTAQPGGFFSDERLKENIKAIGKTFDGQTIHSYNYKGDPRTQIGLIAQEVQKHHPEAVGLAGGYKTVDYDKATEDASDRGHMAYGGLASAGGSVMPQNAGQGFAGGGVAGFDPAVMQQILAMQQAMYAPLSSNNMYAGGPNAGGGLVPQSEITASQLMTPSALPQKATGAEQAKTIVDLGNSINKFGEGVGAWGDDDKKPEPKKDDKPYKDIEDEILNRAMGGGIPYGGQGLDIPDEDDPSKTYQLPTAGDMPDKPKSGFSKAVKAAGTVAKIASMFSDKRMKENIKPIGKLFDGQIVHSYNYKGDPRTQIGLIAQEVEDHKPHAVGLAGKFKTVDYDKATSSAAHRGHFAEGGMPKMPVNSILASLRKEIDPRSNLEELASEQDMELDRNLRPDSMSEQRLGGLRPTSAALLPKSIETPAAGVAGAGIAGIPGPPKTGLAPKIGALPTGIAQIARLIHAGEGTGKNPDSSAKGPYQFIDGTFVDEFRKNYPDRAKGMTKSQIISLKYGPEGAAISSQMGPKFIADNAKIIQRGGHTPDAGNVYLAHFLGAGTALKVLSADPSTPISRLVGEDEINANRILRNGATAGSVINWARGLMAKKERELSRQGRAEGGLAGRDGYQDGGTPKTPEELLALGIDPRNIPSGNPTERPTEDLVIQNIAPAPGMRKVGPLVSENPKAEGLGAAQAVNPVPANGAIGSSTRLASGALNSTIPGEVKVTGVMPPAGSTDAQAQPEKRAGLVKRVFGYDKSKPYDPKTNNKFLQRLGHGETDAVLSALQGLAAMGTAPTRSLGVALSTGLGTGAQAYQAQREFGRQLRETSALETNVEAAKMRANADVATARFNTNTLPNKIAGWRSIAAKDGPNAALATQTANTLQSIFNAAQSDLDGLPGKGVDQLVPSDAPAVGATQAPPAADVKKQRTFGDVIDDLNFQAMAGLPTLALEKELEKAGQGYRIGADGNFEIDPSYVSTTLGVQGPSQRQTGNIGADVDVGREIYQGAVSDNVNYQKAMPLIQSLGTLPKDAVPTTTFINNLAKAVGAALGYDGAEMDAKFGEQPKINSILNAAAAEGINIDPSLGIAGVNMLLNNLNQKAKIAYVRAKAAETYRAKNGFSGGMERYINEALKLNGLTP